MPSFPQVELLFVVFLIVLFVVLGKIAIFRRFALFFIFFVFIIIQIFGDDVQMHGMDLRDFQLRLALRATENLAFFDFVFVDVDFSGTFRAANHGSILRTCIKITAPPRLRSTTVERIIYRREVNTIRAGIAGFAISSKRLYSL
jgi:hypothetical protein